MDILGITYNDYSPDQKVCVCVCVCVRENETLSLSAFLPAGQYNFYNISI